MSKLVPAVIVSLLLLVMASNADARDRHHRGYYGGHHDGYYSGYRGRHHGYRSHRSRRHRDRGAYLIGGLVLGSLITHAITENRANRVERVDRVYRAPVVSGRRLFRDRYGDCFERRQRGGDEILIELDPAQCNW